MTVPAIGFDALRMCRPRPQPVKPATKNVGFRQHTDVSQAQFARNSNGTDHMRTKAQAVVIGGGVIGCSILYHLAKLGWSDVVLLERDELTSGSTWHAAANIHGLHDSTNISRLQHYTMNLYKDLEAETGQSCGVFQPGSLYLAQTEARAQQLRLQEAKAKLYGMNFHEISRDEAERLHPLVDFDGIRCIMYEPDGGNVDPSGVTAAYAAGARARGAEIHRFTPVTATEPRPGGGWIVRTPKGDIETDWVINAAGLWAREVASLAGIKLPLQPTEHQYFVTETIAEIKGLDRRLPSVADRDGEYYLRQEGQGLLIGAYERDVRLWAEKGTPLDFAHELFPDDLERIEDNMMRAIDRVPSVGTAGIKRVINGPMIWSPDSNVLMGPVPEHPGYFACCGIIPGFSQSGGMGLMAAQWVIEGEMQYDMFPWDVARYGDWADEAFTRARVRDQYAHRFAIHFPGEERAAGRPMRMRPAYQMQKDMGAKFGLNYGWEHPAFFDENVEDSAGFTRQPWWDVVGREARALRETGGIIDISNFAKYRVSGPGAEDWLNAVFANNMPREVGRSCLTPLISKRGGIAGDATVTRSGVDEFHIISSGMAERYHKRFFDAMPLPEGTSFTSLTQDMCGFNVAGPRSREMLQRMTNTSLSNGDFAFMRSKWIQVSGVMCLALRVSFTGDLGWELHCATEDQEKLYAALIETGKEFGIGPVGSRALMSLRLEKGYGSWSREYSPEYWPQEAGLDRLCKMGKDFLNKDALAKVLDNPAREVLVTLAVDEDAVTASNADASGGEPIFRNGEGIGRVTSGAYGYGVGMSLALGYLKAGSAAPGDEVQVMILGQPHKATILAEPPFDPKGDRLRG
jgi:dimethylglycine dehydrogenase